MMSVKKLNFRHMSHLKFPSAAAKATREWTRYGDTLDVPSLVLMENMERTGAEVVFMAFKNMAEAFNGARRNERKSGDLVVDSKVRNNTIK